MAKFFCVTNEQLDLCDGSDIRLVHYRMSSAASWQSWTPNNTISHRADIAAGDPEAVRAVCEQLADGYEAMLAFVRFAIALSDGADAALENRNERRADDSYAWSGSCARTAAFTSIRRTRMSALRSRRRWG